MPALATADLSGQVVSEVASRGKHLLLRTDAALTLHTHLEMDGRWELYRPGERWRGPVHEVRVVLEAPARVAVGRRLPMVELISTTREEQALGHLGPDVLGADWNEVEVLSRLRRRPERPVGEALIDQTVMAGPGNIYRSEACFLRGLDPFLPVGEVRDLESLVRLVKRLMEANRLRGQQVTTGDTRPGGRQWVYGHGGEPCRRCGTAIVWERMGPHGSERSVYRCPSCQPRIGEERAG